MHLASLAWLSLISGGLMFTSPAMAQEDPLAPKRAINLARSSAAAANGGLRLYHPASCMFKNPTNNPCLAQQIVNGFEFKSREALQAGKCLGFPPRPDRWYGSSPRNR